MKVKVFSTNKVLDTERSCVLKLDSRATVLVWLVFLCFVQIHVREQHVFESFTSSAFLLSLRWWVDDCIGRFEGFWCWRVGLFNTHLCHVKLTLLYISSAFKMFLVPHQGCWRSVIQTPDFAQISNSGHDGRGELGGIKQQIQSLHRLRFGFWNTLEIKMHQLFRALKELFITHELFHILPCFGFFFFFCWKVNLCPSLKSFPASTRCSS